MGDTSLEAARIRDDVVRGLAGSARLQQAIDASEMARALAMARLRAKHPARSERELVTILLRERFESGQLPPDLR